VSRKMVSKIARSALASQQPVLQHSDDDASSQSFRHQISSSVGGDIPPTGEHCCNSSRQNFVTRGLASREAQVRRDDAAGVQDCKALRMRLARARVFSIQTASKPKAGSLVAVPGSAPETCPGLMASYDRETPRESPTGAPRMVMRYE